MTHAASWRWLTLIILVHLVVSIVHGRAHDGAAVPLSPLATGFVYLVIVAGPLAGLALAWVAERPGAWLIAATLAASLVFGLVNHFVLASPDHVSHVAADWRPLFTTTAVLLALTEALGAVLGLALAALTPASSQRPLARISAAVWPGRQRA